jgi:hypothetical protein
MWARFKFSRARLPPDFNQADLLQIEDNFHLAGLTQQLKPVAKCQISITKGERALQIQNRDPLDLPLVDVA